MTTVSTTFTLTVTNEFPIATPGKSIPSVTYHLGDDFEIVVKNDVFTDTENDPLIYTASYSDDSPLPSWLVFNNKAKIFYGKPTS